MEIALLTRTLRQGREFVRLSIAWRQRSLWWRLADLLSTLLLRQRLVEGADAPPGGLRAAPDLRHEGVGVAPLLDAAPGGAQEVDAAQFLAQCLALGDGGGRHGRLAGGLRSYLLRLGGGPPGYLLVILGEPVFALTH